MKLLILFACSDQVVQKTPNTEPAASIRVAEESFEDGDYTVGETLTLAGNVQDGEAESLAVTWLLGSETLDGPTDVWLNLDSEVVGAEVFLDWVVPDSAGETLTLRLMASDGESSDVADLDVLISPNTDPEVEILAPADGAEIAVGEAVLLEAQVGDAEESAQALSLTWTLSPDVGWSLPAEASSGGLVQATASFDAEGTYTLGLTAEDTLGGRRMDTVSIDVVAANQPPEGCVFTSPASGSAIQLGTPVLLVGEVSDPDDDATALDASFTSSLDGALYAGHPDSSGSFSYSTSSLSAGVHSLSFEVADEAELCSTTLILTVSAGPTVVIESPADGSSVYLGDAVSFEATVTEDGVSPPDLSLSWVSDVDGVLDESAADAYGNAGFATSSLSLGTHAVTLTACDADGICGADTVIVEVEDCNRAWYADLDGDGYGDDSSEVVTCTPPDGHVLLGGDCDDVLADVNPGATEACDGEDQDCDGVVDDGVAYVDWWPDRDGDGFGDETESSTYDCVAPGGWVDNDADCDDGDLAVNPDATETCDGRDEDCDGAVDDDVTWSAWYADADADGYGDVSTSTTACATPAGYVSNATDCDDGDASTWPGATETCDDEDDDCDSVVDDGLATVDWYRDADGDGYGLDAAILADCATTAPAGYSGTPGDCDDGDGGVHPDAAEDCDGEDDDCDGTADDGVVYSTWYRDADGDDWGGSTTSSACSAPSGYVAEGGDCDDSDRSVNPGEAEDECDAIDNDCDGTVGVPDECDSLGCSGSDVYCYDSCGDKADLAEDCGSWSTCSDGECSYEAEDLTSVPTSCSSSGTDIFKATSVTLSGTTSNPYYTVTWKKCDGTSFESDHDCVMRVGSHSSTGAERGSWFTVGKGATSWTTSFYAWSSASEFETDDCGETKELWLTCDEGSTEAHWYGGAIEAEKVCP